MTNHSGRILLVDDEGAIRLTLSALLTRRGYRVTSAANGEEAIQLIEQHQFELFLLDLKMPGLSGLQVARHASLTQPQARIIILTGTATLGDTDEEQVAGFDLMLKTSSPQTVLERVAAVLPLGQPD